MPLKESFFFFLLAWGGWGQSLPSPLTPIPSLPSIPPFWITLYSARACWCLIPFLCFVCFVLGAVGCYCCSFLFYCWFIRFICVFFFSTHRLVGLVVKTSTSRVEDPGFESRLCRDFFRGLSHTSDSNISTPVATRPGAWRYRVSAGTVRPGVSIW